MTQELFLSHQRVAYSKAMSRSAEGLLRPSLHMRRVRGIRRSEAGPEFRGGRLVGEAAHEAGENIGFPPGQLARGLLRPSRIGMLLLDGASQHGRSRARRSADGAMALT
jgi:hypothetical protein